MQTEDMIIQLQGVADKHRNDKLYTFDTNITAMCEDVIPKLKKLMEYEELEKNGLLLRLDSKNEM